MTFFTQRCRWSLVCLGSAQLPSTYPRSNRLPWTREQLSPAGREAKLFWQVATKEFLDSCTARLLLESSRGADQRDTSRLVIISLFLSKWICTAGAGGLIASYGVIQAAVHAPRKSPESSSRQRWKGRAWITVKYSPVNISKKTGKNSAVTQSGPQHALPRPSEGLWCCYCARLRWKGHTADCCGLLPERCNPVMNR